MDDGHRFIRWCLALTLGVAAGQPLSAATQLPYTFRYELQLSDVQCWMTSRCRGIVAEQPDGALSKRIDAHLKTARRSLDLAVYGLRQQDRLMGTIGALQNDGVHIRATVDQTRGQLGEWSEKGNFPYPDAYKLFNILGNKFLKPDRNLDGTPRTSSIMHNKFYIVDGRSVWTGSANLSETGVGKEYNANSSIILHSEEIAELFGKEFDQMFSDAKYGIHKQPHDQEQTFAFSDGTEVSVYFSPQDKPIDSAVVPFIRQAKRSLSVGIFYLTSALVLEALSDAHDRGVDIKIINDATAARHRSSIVQELRQLGIDVRVENWGGKMHMKTAVADGKHTLIGSMNWSDAGNTGNDESVVVIRNQTRLAGDIEAYLTELYEALPSSTMTPGYRDPRAESLESVNSCFDGINNDHIGGVDSQVPSCQR